MCRLVSRVLVGVWLDGFVASSDGSVWERFVAYAVGFPWGGGQKV